MFASKLGALHASLWELVKFLAKFACFQPPNCPKSNRDDIPTTQAGSADIGLTQLRKDGIPVSLSTSEKYSFLVGILLIPFKKLEIRAKLCRGQ